MTNFNHWLRTYSLKNLLSKYCLLRANNQAVCRQQYGIRHNLYWLATSDPKCSSWQNCSPKDQLANPCVLMYTQQWAAKVSHQSESLISSSQDQDLWTLSSEITVYFSIFWGPVQEAVGILFTHKQTASKQCILIQSIFMKQASLLLEWGWHWQATIILFKNYWTLGTLKYQNPRDRWPL